MSLGPRFFYTPGFHNNLLGSLHVQNLLRSSAVQISHLYMTAHSGRTSLLGFSLGFVQTLFDSFATVKGSANTFYYFLYASSSTCSIVFYCRGVPVSLRRRILPWAYKRFRFFTSLRFSSVSIISSRVARHAYSVLFPGVRDEYDRGRARPSSEDKTVQVGSFSSRLR